MKNDSGEQLTFDLAMAELRSIVEQLQHSEIGLDEMTGQAKRAAELIRFCRERLRAADKEVNEIFSAEDLND